MTTLDEIWKIEDGAVRGDRFDGIQELQRGPYAKIITSDGREIKANVTDWTMEFRPSTPKSINIFCLYALMWDDNTISVSSRVTEFGDSVCLFTNGDEFLKRLYKAMKVTGRRFEANLISYVPNEYVGEIGMFRKLSSYSWQSEWRVACFDGPGKPLVLELGDLSDISILVPSSELGTCVNLQP